MMNGFGRKGWLLGLGAVAVATVIIIFIMAGTTIAESQEASAAAAPYEPDKVELCHKTRPDAMHWIIIEVDKSAEAPHLGHGDFPPGSPLEAVQNRCKQGTCPLDFGETEATPCGVRVPFFGAGFCSCNCRVNTITGGTAVKTCKPKCGASSCKYNIENRKLVASCADSDVPCMCTVENRETGKTFDIACKEPAADCLANTCDLKTGDTQKESCTDTGNKCECLVEASNGAIVPRPCKA